MSYTGDIDAKLDRWAGFTRVLSRQWQREFCRCSINVVGGKQCDGCVDHLERFRHNTGPSAKAGKPMTQPAVDPLNRHRFILADIMPPNRQERVVRRIIVCTVQRDAPGFQPLQQPVQRGGITTATFPVDEALARAIKSQPDPQLVLFLRNSIGSRGSISLLEDVAQRLRPPLEVGQNPLPVARLVVGGAGISIVHPMA